MSFSSLSSDALFLNGLNLSTSGTGGQHEDPARDTPLQLQPNLEEDPAVEESPNQRRRLYLVPANLVHADMPEQMDPVNLTPEELQELVHNGLAYVDNMGAALIRTPTNAPGAVAQSPVDWNTVPAVNPWPWHWHPEATIQGAMRANRLQHRGFCQQACMTGNNESYLQ